MSRDDPSARQGSARRRVAIGLSVATVVGIAGAVVHSLKPATCTLSDATTFTVWKLTVGTNHSCNPRGPLRLKLERWIPERFDWLLGSPNFGPGFSTGTESLGIWAAVWDPISRRYSPAGQIGRLELVDAHGCVFGATGWGTCSARGTNPVVASCFFFSAFPRRSGEFTLRLYDGHGHFERDLKLRNPSKRSPTEWRAESLPATRMIGDVRVVLQEIQTGLVEASPDGGSRSVFAPRFSLMQGDKPAIGWTLEHSEFWDATGNWGKALCFREPAWKTIATLWPTPEGPFPTNKIVHLDSLLLPAAAEQRLIPLPPSAQTLPARPFAVAGPGRYMWSNNVCVASLPLRRLFDGNVTQEVIWDDQVVHVSILRQYLVCKSAIRGGDKKLLVRGWDDQGRPFVGKFAGTASDVQFYDLGLPSDAKSIDLELIPEQPLKAEFFVKPPLARPVAR